LAVLIEAKRRPNLAGSAQGEKERGGMLHFSFAERERRRFLDGREGSIDFYGKERGVTKGRRGKELQFSIFGGGKRGRPSSSENKGKRGLSRTPRS